MLSTALRRCKGGYGQKVHAWSAARGGCCILSPAKGWASGSSRTSGLGFLTHRRAFPPHQGLLRKTEEIRHGDSCVWRGNPEGGLPTEHLYILIGVPVAFLLCLLLLGLFLLHRRHERKRGPPRSKGSAPLLTSQMRHQIWPLSTDFLRRVGKWTPHFLGQELGIGSAGRWWLMVCPDVAVKMPTRAAFIGGSTEAGRSISTMAQSPGCGEEPHFPTTRAPPWRPASPSRRDPKEGGTEGTLSSVASPTGGPHSVIFCWSHRPTLLLCGRGLHNGD
ncbi:leukocyte-associated immunoglobulin-like receptor 1 isoform X5 [Orcinus orca]|uniref:leukocyte-associated immunoglobulin-like receptor 1 isoform X5 n=1 Tax=Orcinus orca TaxID=9733 RepID=UPI001441F111|nr:leukocyte-associated immunoglobulin-like receptor 1 isoform X5 [Orcinus orca]